ncbi:unnamed protein product [Laminaria digitata]
MQRVPYDVLNMNEVRTCFSYLVHGTQEYPRSERYVMCDARTTFTAAAVRTSDFLQRILVLVLVRSTRHMFVLLFAVAFSFFRLINSQELVFSLKSVWDKP